MTAGVDLTSRRLQVEDSFEAVNDYLYRLGHTDGLPVVPPTPERVARMLAGYRPDEVIAELPPQMAEATAEKIAINAVMAGCLPEYLPVVVAAVAAVADRRFNPHTVQATTNAATPLLLTNGPIRQKLEINCGHGALGPGRLSNATIGRALRLVMLNVGGSSPGVVSKSTLGQPGRYSLCLGENEEESPWDPLHVERGFPRETSAVTAICAAGTLNIFDNGSQTAEDLLRTVAGSLRSFGSNNVDLPGETCLILSPEHAAMLDDGGFSKHRLQEALFERTSIPVAEVSAGVVAKMRRKDRPEVNGVLYLTPSPREIIIIVAGGQGGQSAYVPTMGGHSWSVTKPIEEKGA